MIQEDIDEMFGYLSLRTNQEGSESNDPAASVYDIEEDGVSSSFIHIVGSLPGKIEDGSKARVVLCLGSFE